MLEDIDLVALYAHCDSSESEARASWRGFMSFVTALLLQVDAETSDEIVSSSVGLTPDSLDAANAEPFVTAVRQVSGELAMAMGMTREFGLAALLDFNPPTRTHQLRVREENQDTLVRSWLTRFQNLQNDEGFQAIMAHWRDRLTLSLGADSAEETLLALELSSPEQVGETESPPQQEGRDATVPEVAETPKSDRRRRKRSQSA